ncbi:MAG: hypothetical protein HPY69_04270 [Armatimonadetes bacterium]|nr:hypothetical protein [Armatimonadota bacterium]
MRTIAVAEFWHETNSFADSPTELGHFSHSAVDSPVLAGMRALPQLLGEEVVWQDVLRVAAPPGGLIADEAWQSLLGELLDGLAGVSPDGVLLSLHGATAAFSEPDVTGAVLSRVRHLVGPQVPIVAALDVHANVTATMLQAADVLLGPHAYPTTDQQSIGRRAAQAMADALKVGARPQVSAWKLPLITTDEGQDTADGVLAHLWEHFPTAESLPGMVSVALFRASPWLDAPALGWVFYQACYCDTPALDERAVVRACWDSRRRTDPSPLRGLLYRQVSRPLYPLDDLEELPLAAWAGDMVHPCHCAALMGAEADGDDCAGCGRCCGRSTDQG